MSLSSPSLDICINDAEVIGVHRDLCEQYGDFLKGIAKVNEVTRTYESDIWILSEEEEQSSNAEFLSALFSKASCKDSKRCLVVVVGRDKLTCLSKREICNAIYVRDSELYCSFAENFLTSMHQTDTMKRDLERMSVHGICPIIRHKYSESKYLSLLSELMDSDEPLLQNRTDTRTKSLIAQRLEYDILGVFPAITHRKLFFKGVVEELLWFLRGSTDTKELSKRGIKFWDANSTREFLDNRGLEEYPVGQLGKSYGYQWRHAGGKWSPDNKHESGVDQIKTLVEGIRKEPYSRRHIISNWVASDIKDIALPPCHVMAQFIVKEGLLSCILIQRSADLVLGVPFNVACYTLLTYLVASACDLVPDKLYHVMNDCHVYENHIKPMKETRIQMYKAPFLASIPKNLASEILENKDAKVSYKDFDLKNYTSGSAMKLKMAV